MTLNRAYTFFLSACVLLIFLNGALAADNPLQAEDLLYQEPLGTMLSEETQASLKELIKQRIELIKTVEPLKFKKTETYFGIRTDESSELVKWGKEENNQVRRLIPSGEKRNTEKFSNTRQQTLEDVMKLFQPTHFPDLRVNYSAPTDPAANSSLELIAQVKTDKAHLQQDKIETEGDITKVYVSLIIPDYWELRGQQPQSLESKLQIQPEGISTYYDFYVRVVELSKPWIIPYILAGRMDVKGTFQRSPNYK